MRTLASPLDSARLFLHGDRTAPGAKLDFSVNLNPLGPPRSLARRVFQTVSLARYPDPECAALRDALAQRHGVEPCQVVVGNGANDLIYLVARTLRPRRVAIVEPTYTEYLRASLAVGAEIAHWLPLADTLQAQPFDPGTADLVWLCNPNNPTGAVWTAPELRAWIAGYPRTMFIVDEAFLPFLAEEAEHTLAPFLARLANLVIIRSLTKVYTIPGLRLGYALASPEMAERLRMQAVPWGVNALAQEAGLAALADHEFLQATHAWLRDRRASWLCDLAACSPRLQPLPSTTNFALLRLHGITAPLLTRELLERGIAIRDASNFVGLDDRYVRVALRLPEENEVLLRELRILLEKSE